MNTTETTAEKLPSGCLFDGALGYETTARRVIELAKERGLVWPVDHSGEPSNLGADDQVACEYLARYCCPANHWVGYRDGDFGAWPILYKENQVRYIIDQDERGEFAASLYKVDPETGDDEPEPFFSLTTEDAAELADNGVNVQDGRQVVDFYATYSGAFAEPADRYTVLESDDAPKEDEE